MEADEIRVGAKYAVKRRTGVANVEVKAIIPYTGFVTHKQKQCYLCINTDTGKKVTVMNAQDFTTLLSSRTD